MAALVNGLLSLGIIVALVVVLSIIMKRLTKDPTGEEGETEEQNELGRFSINWSINDKDDSK